MRLQRCVRSVWRLFQVRQNAASFVLLVWSEQTVRVGQGCMLVRPPVDLADHVAPTLDFPEPSREFICIYDLTNASPKMKMQWLKDKLRLWERGRERTVR